MIMQSSFHSQLEGSNKLNKHDKEAPHTACRGDHNCQRHLMVNDAEREVNFEALMDVLSKVIPDDQAEESGSATLSP